MEYIIITVATAVIGAMVGLLFHRIEKKIDRMEADNEKHHREQVEVRIAERELLLAEAHISALTARCVRGEKVNGDLEKAEGELAEKTERVQDVSRRIFEEHMEG